MQVREKVAMICGSEGSKSRLAKAAGAETSGQMRDEKLHAVVASLLFDPPEPQNTGKTQCVATSLPFRAPASSLF